MKRAYANIPEGQALLFHVAVTSSNESPKVITSLSKKRNTRRAVTMTPKLFSPWHLPKLLLSASKEPMSTMVECEKKVNSREQINSDQKWSHRYQSCYAKRVC